MTNQSQHHAKESGHRRQFLKAVTATGSLAALSPTLVVASDESQRFDSDVAIQAQDLLPVDRAGTPQPEIGVDSQQTTYSIDRTRTAATRQGQTALDLGCQLDGEGQLALSGTPYLETTWTAPQTGEHALDAVYQSSVGIQQTPFTRSESLVSAFPKTALAAMDTRTGEAIVQPFIDAGIITPKIDETMVETALALFAQEALEAALGPFANYISPYVLQKVIDRIVGNSSGRLNTSRLFRRQLRFWARKNRTYRLFLYTIGGCTGVSHRRSGGYRTALSTQTNVREFSIRPTRVNTGNRLTIAKENTPEGLGMYAVTVTGTLAREKESEAWIEGNTALDWVGPKRGTDHLYYSGEIERFLLKGNAVPYHNGSRFEAGGRTASGGGQLPNTLTVTKDGATEGLGAYVVTVDGDLGQPGDSEAVVSGSTALDWVGPKRGTDRLQFSGNITKFILKGNARVYVNGDRINPDVL